MSFYDTPFGTLKALTPHISQKNINRNLMNGNVMDQSLKKFMIYLHNIDYNSLFYDATTLEKKPFKEIFPICNYAIVGNSPISLIKNNGKLINSHDCVVRFNNFKIKNYENYVGTKTNIWITGAGVQSPDSVPENNQKILKILIINNTKNNLKKKRSKIVRKYGKDKLNSFVIFHNNELINESIKMLGGTPTTGFLTLLILTKYKNVNSFGFSFGSFNRKYHYYYDNVKQDIGHKWDRELEFFKIMVHRNLFNNDDLKLIKNNNDKKQRLNIRNEKIFLKNTNFKFHNKQNRIRSRAGRLNNPHSRNIFNTKPPPRFLPPLIPNKKLISNNNNINDNNNINKRLISLLENLEKD